MPEGHDENYYARVKVQRTKTHGARMEIHPEWIEVYDDNNDLRVRVGNIEPQGDQHADLC